MFDESSTGRCSWDEIVYTIYLPAMSSGRPKNANMTDFTRPSSNEWMNLNSVERSWAYRVTLLPQADDLTSWHPAEWSTHGDNILTHHKSHVMKNFFFPHVKGLRFVWHCLFFNLSCQPELWFNSIQSFNLKGQTVHRTSQGQTVHIIISRWQ